MIRNRFHHRFIHHGGSGSREGCTGRDHPVFGSLGSSATRTHFNPAGIDGLLGFATGQICLGIDRAFAGQILAFLAGFGVANNDQLGIGIVLQPRATSSRMALQVLSTRHGFTLLGKSHSLSLLASGGGGGGFSTVTGLELLAVRPRESVQVALTVIVPDGCSGGVESGGTAVAGDGATAGSPTTRSVTGTLSGLVQVQVSVEAVPAWTDVGFAEQDMVGGFFGGSFTVKVACNLPRRPSSFWDR